MPEYLKVYLILSVAAPLLGSLLTGLAGRRLGRKGAHTVTIFLMIVCFIFTLLMAHAYLFNHEVPQQWVLYHWVTSGSFQFDVGFLLDRLSAVMLCFVTFVSLMVHVYTVGYMSEDPGYQRFFSYVSLFTFAMMCLVLANNFLMLFFGWEGVGLVSYLLIGFWYNKDGAVFGSLKAFIANRVGDVGFLLGIAAILVYFGSVNYTDVFMNLQSVNTQTLTVLPMWHWNVITMICLLLLVGAMGKSAQMPLHVWLPESMEGPTPISALIHAATMVTAGIYMIARMSPMFELSTTALSVVLVVGATTALFTGLLGVFHHDIKRVIAYSTLSQLGYMVAALGVSAYAAGMFHLFTHACFKALLFLSAGSVIIAMHHEQDMRKMGGLWRYLPITYVTFFIGALALTAIPPFSGFYSKDSIIEAVGMSTIPGAKYAYVCVLIGAFVTALYTFRAFFLTFHGREKMSDDARVHLKESPWVMTLPLILLAIPAFALGFLCIYPMLYAVSPLLGSTLCVLPAHDTLLRLAPDFHGAWLMIWHAFVTWPFWLSIAGIIVAYLFNVRYPAWANVLKLKFAFLYNIMLRKYGFDDFNQFVLTRGTVSLARFLFKRADDQLLDKALVNGSAHFTRWLAFTSRLMQTGYIYHYAFAMVMGLLVFLVWMLLG